MNSVPCRGDSQERFSSKLVNEDEIRETGVQAPVDLTLNLEEVVATVMRFTRQNDPIVKAFTNSPWKPMVYQRALAVSSLQRH